MKSNFALKDSSSELLVSGGVYEQYLVKLEDTPALSLDNSLEGYPRELVSCLQGINHTRKDMLLYHEHYFTVKFVLVGSL